MLSDEPDSTGEEENPESAGKKSNKRLPRALPLPPPPISDGVAPPGEKQESFGCFLPDRLPTLNALYESVGTNFDLSLDVKDPAAFTAILKISASFQATSRLWLCFPHWETAATWREHKQEFHLVDSPTQDLLTGQHERRAVQLSSAGFDAINMPEPSWTAGHVALFHRFGLRCLAWDAQQPRQIDRLLKIGVDGIYGDHVERLVTAEQRFFKAR